MKFLLSSLAGLSLLAGGLAPTISNLNKNENKINLQQEKIANYSKDVSLGETVKISTDQNEKTWEVTFDWNSSSSINKIQFHGGLRSYSAWGSDHWDYTFENVDAKSDGQIYTIQNDRHSSGLAKQQTMIYFTLTNVGGTNYKLKMTFSTKSYNSFTGSWGNFTVGDKITFMN